MTLSEKSAEAGHRAVSLHGDCVLVLLDLIASVLALLLLLLVILSLETLVKVL